MRVKFQQNEEQPLQTGLILQFVSQQIGSVSYVRAVVVCDQDDSFYILNIDQMTVIREEKV